MKKKIIGFLMLPCLMAGILGNCYHVQAASTKQAASDKIILRVSNWEEYIDEGDWGEDEIIDLDSGNIFGENNLVDEFEDWYKETYGKEVKVEYSTFGSNEDFYNMYTLGNEYDLVCPSEYMMMKLAKEDLLLPFSDEFKDSSKEYNYYTKGLSPYIKGVFDRSTVDEKAWSDYFAGYMWGITGIVYNPAKVTKEEASTWRILSNPKFKRQITVKDNVRDTYFAGLGAIKTDLLTSETFKNDPNYVANLEKEMNDVNDETIQQVQDYLQDVKDNSFSFESDAGKADLMTGKVVANLQWSGDGVYTLDQADKDGVELAFAVPKEATNIYFDGWCLMKSGIGKNAEKQHAAEAFINFLSRPDNVIRNMYYVGYTSCISGGDDRRIFEYADWNFAAEDDEEDVTEYPLGYFFTGNSDDEDYVITAPTSALNRQLFSQYPDEETIGRSSIMVYFDPEVNAKINQLWINVRCYNLYKIPVWAWILVALMIAAVAGALIHKKIRESSY